ncbi:peptidoglycan-binding protein [Sorangium sp. So ce118]
MARDHRVRDGECISSIASDHNLSWETVWNHPNNAALKQKRKSPNLLKKGDSVHVPDPVLKEHPAATAAMHKFVLKRPKAQLRLRVVGEPPPKPRAGAPAPPPPPDRRRAITEDPEPDTAPLADEPRAGVAYVLEIEGASIRGETDSDGRIACDIPPNARTARLILEPETPRETILPLALGHLDPLEEVSGVKQRLANLTFGCGEGDDETPELAAALRAFQEKHGLSVTGEVDQATRDKLREVHDG